MEKKWIKNYEAWINHPNIAESLKEEALKMDNNQRSQAFDNEPFKFGTAGYRQKMGPGTKYLNEITYSQLAYGYGQYLKSKFIGERPIIVVHDNRMNSDFFAEVVANTLSSLGINVLLMPNNDVLSTPILSYMIINLKAVGGVNITASHNPKEYNGFKCYNDHGSQLLPNEDDQLVANIPNWQQFLEKQIKPDPLKIKVLDVSIIDKYFEDIKKTLKNTNPNIKKPRKFLFTPMHGTSSFYMPKFLNSLGYECIKFEQQSQLDPEFTNTPIINPEEAASFNYAIEYADKNGINLIFAADPDADRLGIAFKKKNKWEFLNGNAAGIIETYYLLMTKQSSNKRPVIVSTFVTNNLIDRIAKEYNAKVVRTATGFKWIAAAVDAITPDEEFIIGFEEAIGSLPSNINREKDAYQAAALLLEILTYYEEKNYDFYDILEHEIFTKFGHWYGQTDFRIIQGNQWQDLAKEYLNQVLNFPHKSIFSRQIISITENKQAGTVDFNFENDSWLKFRISGTEPKFKMYFNLYRDETQHLFNPLETISLHEEVEEISEFISQYLGI